MNSEQFVPTKVSGAREYTENVYGDLTPVFGKKTMMKM